MKYISKIYAIRNKKTLEIVTLGNKKTFLSIGHIKNMIRRKLKGDKSKYKDYEIVEYKLIPANEIDLIKLIEEIEKIDSKINNMIKDVI